MITTKGGQEKLENNKTEDYYIFHFIIYSNAPWENNFPLPKAGSDTWTSDIGLLTSEGQKGDETELMCPFLSLSFLSFAVVG